MKYPIWCIRCIEQRKINLVKRTRWKYFHSGGKQTSAHNKILSSGLCEICGEFYFKKLEYAHIMKTDLNGSNRGSWQRFKDFVNNRDKYMLLCHKCHQKIDLRLPVS